MLNAVDSNVALLEKTQYCVNVICSIQYCVTVLLVKCSMMLTPPCLTVDVVLAKWWTVLWWCSPDIMFDLCDTIILSQRSTESSLHFVAWFLSRHALWTVGAYIHGSVPFWTMSYYYGLQLSSGHIWCIIKVKRIHLTTIWNATTKGLNTFLNKRHHFFIF